MDKTAGLIVAVDSTMGLHKIRMLTPRGFNWPGRAETLFWAQRGHAFGAGRSAVSSRPVVLDR